jgi:cytochrome c oxidase cbb3-type subunit 4
MFWELALFAKTGGLVILVLLFAGALTYALWPRNQDRFDRAARAPLDEADGPEQQDGSHV